MKAGLSLFLLAGLGANAQPVSFTNTYTQDFQSITPSPLAAATVATTTMLQVSAQNGGGSVTGWYLYHQAAGTPRWGRTDGSSNTGSFYGFFDGQSTPNRALGSQGSASIVAYWGIVLQNNSGSTINQATISYDAMIARNPSTTVNSYPMSYRVTTDAVVTGSSTGTGTFNDAAGTWTSGIGFSTPAAGIGAPNATQSPISPLFRIGGAAITQTLAGLNWGPGQYLYIRWKETDEPGADATAGVDNFSIQPACAAPSITAPPAVTAYTNNGCSASGVALGTPVFATPCGFGSLTTNAPSAFPLGSTVVTYTLKDINGVTATATQTVSVQDTSKPGIGFLGTKNIPGITGPSSSQSPYLDPSTGGIQFKSMISVGDAAANGYRMVGVPDGLGAFDNGDGTFTVLMNHELVNTVGIPRAHGGAGAFVSKWVFNKSTLAAVSGSDLMQQYYRWDTTTHTFILANGTAFSRFCSVDLANAAAFFNSATGLGTSERIFLNGEESGVEGRALAHVVTGPDAGKSFELAYLGKFSWENSVASPASGVKTVVGGMDDGTGGQVYFYIGTKTRTGNDVEKAGLMNGKLYGVKVTGLATETTGGVPAPGTHFDLVDQGNVSSKTGATLNTESVAAGVTTFLRPEDGAWDPIHPNDFYFNTTDAFNAPSRLWRLRFNDVANPETGGTIEAVLDGTEGQQMFDNMAIDNYGKITLLEDVGNNAHIGKVWQYDIATDQLKNIAHHDSTRFLTGAPNFLTQDEESSGVIDVSDILGAGAYLIDVQAHYTIPGELAEGGQLLFFKNTNAFGNATAQDTVRVALSGGQTTATGVVLGTPATADNCSVASVTNDAPSSFPIGTTTVTYTVTDGSGNTTTGKQYVVVSDTGAPSITAPPAITVAANIACSAGGFTLGAPTATDNNGIASITNNAPSLFPLGLTTVTYTATDSSGNIATATQLVTVVDTTAPGIGLLGTKNLPGITGPSSSQSPYLDPSTGGIQFKSMISVGDAAANGYRMVGVPDGLGAFDNGDGTFTVLMNHELVNTVGIPRAHGGAGAFVSKWVFNKSTLAAVSGSDLMQQYYRWDTTTHTFILANGTAFSRFCSADLANPAAFYNSASGLGTTERIFLNGEESGNEGRALGHVVTGPDAGKSFELAYLGKFSWENSVASPASGVKTVVGGMDDGTGGQVYFYVGTKKKTGNDIEKAGLLNGKLYGCEGGWPGNRNQRWYTCSRHAFRPV